MGDRWGLQQIWDPRGWDRQVRPSVNVGTVCDSKEALKWIKHSGGWGQLGHPVDSDQQLISVGQVDVLTEEETEGRTDDQGIHGQQLRNQSFKVIPDQAPKD